MGRNNYPQGSLDEIEPGAVQRLVGSLRELHDKGRPESDMEVRNRIDEYFGS